MRFSIGKHIAALVAAIVMFVLAGTVVTYADDNVDASTETAEAATTAAATATATPQNEQADYAATVADLLARLLPAASPAWLTTVTALAALIILAVLADQLVRRIALVIIERLVHRTRTTWDDALRDAGVFRRLVPIIPVTIVHWGIVLVPHLADPVIIFVQRLALATLVLLVVRSLGTLLTAVNGIYQRYPIARNHPIKGYLQVAKVVAYVFAGILIFATLMDQSPWFFLSGMGAMTAILMLVFRDTLLSFVAGIQLVNNGVIRVGDWIEMPQFNADGDVIDIALNIVTVQNWDKTVTVIPTHKFLDHSFKNWRAMQETGGRRIKRPIYIDMSTIRFLHDEEIQRFSRFLLLKDYMREKVDELKAYNREHCPDELSDVVTNARRLTNVGTFRAYVVRYLQQHPLIHKKLTFLVRQLQPTAQGLPLEIYVFTSDTRWAVYEGIQADIFDHLLAVLPEFGLRAFQQPTGYDVAMLGRDPTATSRGNGQQTTDALSVGAANWTK